ncbi:hypothetical protein DAPPUDRAFT_100542 [Daphnia pulex]|uniref:Uncharacterized protein n=1 Tax=Daphnia pulex TaxID=6669 RepID=E9GAN9_DAPPU|nr:hypothetical protein DAPPUDRAFT_100542 [Daphnia pulex]|eukprot:EFX83506.1 hypothetical protein DAPPUDRAFT_100542 [Daphnia pulex]
MKELRTCVTGKDIERALHSGSLDCKSALKHFPISDCWCWGSTNRSRVRYGKSAAIDTRSSLDLLKCLHQHRFSISSKTTGAPPTYILAPKRKRKTKTKNRKKTPIFIFCYMRANARDSDASRPRREKRGPTRGTVKRYLQQEKALELTADFMVNWIRFETSVDSSQNIKVTHILPVPSRRPPLYPPFLSFQKMYINEDKILKKDKKLRLSLAQKFKRWEKKKRRKRRRMEAPFILVNDDTRET